MFLPARSAREFDAPPRMQCMTALRKHGKLSGRAWRFTEKKCKRSTRALPAGSAMSPKRSQTGLFGWGSGHRTPC